MPDTAMAMAMLGSSASLSSQLCSVSGRTSAVTGQPQVQVPGGFSLKRSGAGGVYVRAQQGRGSSGMFRSWAWVLGRLGLERFLSFWVLVCGNGNGDELIFLGL